MNIVIISEFCEDFSKSDNDRFFYLMRMLLPEHRTELIASSFHHTGKRQRKETADPWPQYRITFIDEPGYPKNVCLKRFQSHYIWGRHLIRYLKSLEKPDVVYCAVPSLSGPSRVAKYCRKNGIRFIVDVQDLWPEAFEMVLRIPLVSRIIFAPFRMLANGIYRRADHICAVSEAYCAKAAGVNRQSKGTTAVYLGTELDTFDRYAAGTPILEKAEGEIWLTYCGTLGSSYDILGVIDALALLHDPRLKFVVIGNGPQMEEFEAYAREKAVNAVFTGRVQYDQMCSLLRISDMVVNPIVHGSPASIINKHADYAACGLPVLNTQESPEYRQLVDEYRMGFNCANGDPKDLADKLRKLADDPAMRKTMGAGARRCAEERFDRKHTYRQLVKAICGEGE